LPTRTILLLPLAALLLLAGSADAQTRARDRGDAWRAGFAATLVFSGDELYAGRPGELALFPSPPNHTGTVHRFTRGPDGAWVEQGTITTTSATIGDGFGSALAVEGDLMVVGAPKADSSAGAAFLFERSDGEWREVARLEPERPAPGKRFGASVAIGGDNVLIGMPGERNGTGAVVVFRRGAAGWARGGLLAPGDARQGDGFGTALAARAERVVVGGPGPQPWLSLFGGQAPRAGAAWIFARSADGGWRSEGRFTPGGEEPAVFGTGVALAGDDVLVAAPFAAQGVGHVIRYRRDAAGAWTEADRITAQAPGTGFGMTLAVAGNDLFVGTPLANGTGGAVVFRRQPDGAYASLQTIASSAPFGFAGTGLAATDRIAIIGAPGADYFEGTGLVFTRADSAAQWALTDTLMAEVRGLEPITGGAVECNDGKVGPFDCSEVDLVSFLPVSAVGGERGMIVNDLWGWTDPQTNREYAIVGRADGTVFVDLTDPANPIYLGELPLTAGATPNLWRDMKVYSNHVYIVADGVGNHGVQIFDLTQLRGLSGEPRTFTETAHYDRIHSAHNIVINEETGFAYVVGASMGGETCGGGLHMIDIREPQNPRFAGCFQDARTGNAGTGYSHDAQCINYAGPDQRFAGREICFGANETALSIADVTDKENPVAVSTAAYPNGAYLHQGWVSYDHRFLFMNDEGDELANLVPRTRTLVWDISELDDPILLTEFLGETPATDHNLYIRGRYMYQSNYVAGLRIIDITDPANPSEVGWFDTVPWGEDAAGFAGSWSNYPYFQSGNVVVTSMREGIFILRPRMQDRPVS
jgi:choice-of-anchor B domain-containing protein